LRLIQIIDYSATASLPLAFGAPSYFSDSTRALDQCALLGPKEQSQLKRSVFFLSKKVLHYLSKYRRLHEVHGSIYAIGVPESRESERKEVKVRFPPAVYDIGRQEMP
jgi:hypothetical protein